MAPTCRVTVSKPWPANRPKNKPRKERNTTITPEMQAAQWKPGQSGNPSGRPSKPFTAALLRIVEKKIANDPDGRVLLDAIAQQLIAKASKGDLASIRELADRIEGTPGRSITLGGEGGGAIGFISLNREENERRIMELMAQAGPVDSAD
jgi:hypothetical protein